jgi:hypothetical protein
MLKALEPNRNYAENLKYKITQEMEANLHSFVDDRAIHGVAREMR